MSSDDGQTDAPPQSMKRCAIYTRNATASARGQVADSPEAQREACRRFIETQPGWRAIPLTYVDVGFSGADIDRPALQRLLFDVGAGAVDVVVVHDVTRLTRSPPAFRTLMKRFKKAGVALVMLKPSPYTSISTVAIRLVPPRKTR
jgi:site-specific DNA recombinase